MKDNIFEQQANEEMTKEARKAVKGDTIEFLDGLNTANECRADVIKICMDNKIDASEQPRFKKRLKT